MMQSLGCERVILFGNPVSHFKLGWVFGLSSWLTQSRLAKSIISVTRLTSHFVQGISQRLQGRNRLVITTSITVPNTWRHLANTRPIDMSTESEPARLRRKEPLLWVNT